MCTLSTTGTQSYMSGRGASGGATSTSTGTRHSSHGVLSMSSNKSKTPVHVSVSPTAAAAANNKSDNGLKSVIRTRNKTVATPAKKFLSAIGMATHRQDYQGGRDADYTGDDAPFSPHMFVGIDESWHDDSNVNINWGGADGTTRICSVNDREEVSARTDPRKISQTLSSSPMTSSSASSPLLSSPNTSETATTPASHSVPVAVGSVLVSPHPTMMPPHDRKQQQSVPRSLMKATADIPPPSTGVSRYYTPQDYIETPGASGAASSSLWEVNTPTCSVGMAIEAEADTPSPTSRSNDSSCRSGTSFRWGRGKSRKKRTSPRSPADRSPSAVDDDVESVSTIVSARSICGGSYDVLVGNSVSSKDGNGDDPTVSVQEVYATSEVAAATCTFTPVRVPSGVKVQQQRFKHSKSLRAMFRKPATDDTSKSSSQSIVSTLTADECHLSHNTVVESSGKSYDPAGEEAIDLAVGTLPASNVKRRPSAIPEEDICITKNDGEVQSCRNEERLGGSPVDYDGSPTSSSMISPSLLARTPRIGNQEDAARSTGLSRRVTHNPTVALPPTPPPAPPLFTSPASAANSNYAKSVARLTLNQSIDAINNGSKKASRPLRPELLEDDFSDYFDSICSSSLNVQTSTGNGKRHLDERGDGLTWNTSLDDVHLDLSAYEAPPPPSKTASSPPGSAPKNWLEKRDHVKSQMKLREDMAVVDLVGTHGLSTGLARIIHRSTIHKLPLRVWLVDNSASMRTGDGRLFIDGSNDRTSSSGKKSGRVSQMITCTRWEELSACVLYHAEVAASIGAPTIFRLLNDPNVFIKEEMRQAGEDDSLFQILPQVAGVCARRRDATDTSGRFRNMLRLSKAPNDEDEEEASKRIWEGIWQIDLGSSDGTDLGWRDRAEEDLRVLESVLFETIPCYTTPLAGHIWAVFEQIKGICSTFSPGQRVAIVIASDGVPNQPQSFLDAMAELQKLPVYLIVRLCTNDEASFQFWTTLDLDLDIAIEILDDFEAEAEAAFTMNPWCNYCMPLQRAREWGFRTKLLESLRERPLTHDELRDYCALIFGVKPDLLPDPTVDWATFYYDIEALNAREKRQFNPLEKRNRGWIDLKAMAKMYGGKAEVARRKVVMEARKQEEKMRKERQRVLELKKKARAKSSARSNEKKALPRTSILSRKQDPDAIGLGHC